MNRYLIHNGELWRIRGGTARKVTSQRPYFLGRAWPRLTVIWYLWYHEWPNGHVISIDGTEKPKSLKVVPYSDGTFRRLT